MGRGAQAFPPQVDARQGDDLKRQRNRGAKAALEPEREDEVAGWRRNCLEPRERELLVYSLACGMRFFSGSPYRV